MDKIQSKTIDLLRFPLAVFVVFIHATTTMQLTTIEDADFPLLSGPGIYNLIEVCLTNGITIIAVPVFFVISGFLFFQKLNTWNWKIYKSKIHSRVKTLLVPYLCWILLSFLCLGGIPAIGKLLETKDLTVAWLTFYVEMPDLYKSFWDVKVYPSNFPNWFGVYGESSYPLVTPLWFVRDLIMVMVLSPIIFFYLKFTKIYGLCLLGFCYFMGLWPNIHGFGIISFFYYGMGAYIAINELNIIVLAKKFRYLAIPIAITCVAVLTCYYGPSSLLGTRVSPFYVLAGVWSAFYIASYLVEKRNVNPNKFLVQSCFFVYALHIAPIYKHKNLLRYVYDFTANCFDGIPHVELLQFLLPPIITIGICLGLFWLLQKTCPPLCNVLTGNRGNK